MANNLIARVRLAALAATAAAALASAPAAFADGRQQPMTPAEVQKAQGVTKQIPLGNGALNLDIRKGYLFLSAAEVSSVLRLLDVEPPSAPILGGVEEKGLAPGARDYWIAVITQDPIGHVPETGANDIASMTFLESVKAARPPSPALVAFSQTPIYTPQTKQLIWAERYDRKPPLANTRVEERLLGRDSVAGVTTIGSSTSFNKLSKACKDVLAMLSFAPGRTYEDFVAATDRPSEYDLPGLITGKRKAGPVADNDGAASAPMPAPAAPGLSLADFGPGGKFQWAPWLGGGIVVLSGAFFAVSALRRGSSGIDYTIRDSDGNPL